MSYTEATIQLLSPEGSLVTSDASAEYLPYIEALSDEQLREFHRQMVVVRRFDIEATNLQKQGQMGLWVPSIGQEGAQVGSGFAARAQDHIFPAYREHAVARIRGVDLLDVVKLLRGTTHGGWNPAETGNFHLYTLVIAAHTLHATGYAMGITLDGKTGTGNVDSDEAVIVYFGDGSTSQGDANEALVFAASYQTPQVFFLQNNHWAISVPVTTQSRLLARISMTLAPVPAPATSRPSPTALAHTPRVTTPRSTARTRNSTTGPSVTRSPASRRTCAAAARAMPSSRTCVWRRRTTPPTSAAAPRRSLTRPLT
jgi:hypothetical protein